MARTVQKQSKGCLGCSLVILIGLIGLMFFHRYVWRERKAPDLARLNRLRMSQVNRSYYTFYDRNGRYPENFGELLSPENYVPGAEQDVWGNEFRILEDRGTVYLYSLGPDLTDDRMQVTYDPTNGADSRGDQIYVLRRPRAGASP